MQIRRQIILLMCVLITGCTFKKAAYTTVGAAAGGTVGYAFNKDKNQATIGAVAGAAGGALLATIQENTESKKYKAGYEKGYNQAQVDIAVQNWNENTGKCAFAKKNDYKHLTKFRVPERKQDDVVYESHYVTLEDYR